MGDIISYVYEFGGFTFAEKPFCEIDGLVFSHLSYLMELFQELKIMNPLSHYAM